MDISVNDRDDDGLLGTQKSETYRSVEHLSAKFVLTYMR